MLEYFLRLETQWHYSDERFRQRCLSTSPEVLARYIKRFDRCDSLLDRLNWYFSEFRRFRVNCAKAELAEKLFRAKYENRSS